MARLALSWGPALAVLLAFLAFAGAARAADEPALLDAMAAPPPAAAPASGAAPLTIDETAVPAVTEVGVDDPAPVQQPGAAAVAAPPPPAATTPPPAPAAPSAATEPPAASAAAMPDPAADFQKALGATLKGLVGDTLLGGLPETILPDLRDELSPTAGLIGQVRDSVRTAFEPWAPSPAPGSPAPTPPGAGAGTPPPVVSPDPLVAPVRAVAVAVVPPVAALAAPVIGRGDPGPAPAALDVAGLVRAADRIGVAPEEGAAPGPPGTSRPGAIGTAGAEPGVAPLAAASAASAVAAPIPTSARPASPGPQTPIPPAPVSERTAPAGTAPAGPTPILPPAQAPAPSDPTGLAGVGGGTTSTLLLGVAALLGLIALARPPNGTRRLTLQPAPYVPAFFAVSLERPG